MRRWSKGRRVERQRFDRGAPIAKIDTRPMVFVLMFVVLLIIFTAKSPVHAIIVQLPHGQTLPSGEAPYAIVSVAPDGAIQFDGEPTPLENLGTQIAETKAALVVVKANAQTSYGAVAQALARVSQSGIPPNSICFDPAELGAFRNYDSNPPRDPAIYDLQSGPQPNAFTMIDGSSLPEYESCDQFLPAIP